MNSKFHSSEISVFVDESGSFGRIDECSRFYLLCMVFHDQATPLDAELSALEIALSGLGLPESHCIHAGPLIRREREYANMNREMRRSIFSKMLAFMRRANVRYRCFTLDRKYSTGEDALHTKLLSQISDFIKSQKSALSVYDSIKIYYDNGQHQITSLLKEAFGLFHPKVHFAPSVVPANYRLFQFADVACTLELAALKLDSRLPLSPSEQTFFEGERNFKKNHLRTLRHKKWE